MPYNYYKSPQQLGYPAYTPAPYPGTYPGYYQPNPYAPGYPMYNGAPLPAGYVLPAPVPVAGGFFRINNGNTQLLFWKSPSGYYYPWCAQAYPYAQTNVFYMQEGSNQPAQPPLDTMFSDMQKYLQESKDKGKLTDGSYNHLKLRLSDLLKMQQAAREEGGGALSSADEAEIRTKATDLGMEISRSVK
jgi:hypothetical protein